MEGRWSRRGYLPHFDCSGLIQGVTFRLADALPVDVVTEMAEVADVEEDHERRAKLETFLNAGYGACYLRDARVAQLMESTLRYYDGERYHLIAWVVMPNHVHALIETVSGYTLHDVVQGWKSYTAHEANLLLGRSGAFWYPDYFDRYIRDERHFVAAVSYIHNNPVAAGLVDTAEAWRFSSVRFGEGGLGVRR